MSPKTAILILIILAISFLVIVGGFYLVNKPKEKINTQAGLNINTEKEDQAEANSSSSINNPEAITKEDTEKKREEMEAKLDELKQAKDTFSEESGQGGELSVEESSNIDIIEEGSPVGTTEVQPRESRIADDEAYDAKVKEMQAKLDALKKAKESIIQ